MDVFFLFFFKSFMSTPKNVSTNFEIIYSRFYGQIILPTRLFFKFLTNYYLKNMLLPLITQWQMGVEFFSIHFHTYNSPLSPLKTLFSNFQSYVARVIISSWSKMCLRNTRIFRIMFNAVCSEIGNMCVITINIFNDTTQMIT